jgi:hypothetical protein
MSVPQSTFLYQPEALGKEFSVITYVRLHFQSYLAPLTISIQSDFLETLDDGSFFAQQAGSIPSSMMPPSTFCDPPPSAVVDGFAPPTMAGATESAPPLPLPPPSLSLPQDDPPQKSTEEPVPVILPAATKKERFLLTAADQESGSRDERLNRVIRSKYEAGLLKPYNYVKGYTRLSRWMDRKSVHLSTSTYTCTNSIFLLKRLSGIKATSLATAFCTTAQVQGRVIQYPLLLASSLPQTKGHCAILAGYCKCLQPTKVIIARQC